MTAPIEDINGFSNLVFFQGRSFDNLKEQMIQSVRVPARILDIGLKPNGFPYAILQVSVLERPQIEAAAAERPQTKEKKPPTIGE